MVHRYDLQMTTNHLSHFLLVRELLPLLERRAHRAGEARIVHMTSEARKIPYHALNPVFLGPNQGKLGGDGNLFQVLHLNVLHQSPI